MTDNQKIRNTAIEMMRVAQANNLTYTEMMTALCVSIGMALNTAFEDKDMRDQAIANVNAIINDVAAIDENHVHH